MTTTPTSHSDGLTAQQTRNARRVAIALLMLTVPSTVVFGVLAYQSQAWQMTMDTGILMAFGLVTIFGLRVIQRGRAQLGMQIILFAMGAGILVLDLLVAGLGVLLGIAASLLITVIATLTLPERLATPISITSFGLGLLIALLDALLPAYRLLVPELAAYAPVVILVMAATGIYLIARQFGSYSMRGKLTLTLLLVAILPLIIQGAAFDVLAQARLTEMAQQQLLAAAKQTAERIDRFSKDAQNEAKASARLPDVIDFLSAPPDQRTTVKVAPIFETASGKERLIRSYAIYDTHGIIVYDTNRQNWGLDQSDKPYVREPLLSGEVYVSGIIFDEVSDEPLIHISAPVRPPNGDVIGVVRVAYSLQAIQEIVKQSEGIGGLGSFGMLFDENHFVLADSSDSRRPFQSVAPLSPETLTALQTARRVPEGDLAELLTDLPELEAGLKQAEEQSHPFFVAEAGETFENVESTDDPDEMAVYQLEVGAERWLMVFGQAQHFLLTPINDLARSSLFLVLAISAVTIFVAARVSQVLARPVLSLNQAASQIAQGNLHVRADVNTADEIGALAATFNSMTEQISSLVGSLEQQVAARTEQLRASAEVGRAATSMLEPRQLTSEIVNLVTDRFGFYYAALFLLDREGRYAVLQDATGEAGRILKERGHRLEVNSLSMVGSAISMRQARIALDVGHGATRFANPLLPGTRSEIALPLIVGNRVLGALDVQSTQAAAFDDASAELLQNMANQVGIALVNAETLSRSQQQARTLAVLNRASRDLAQAATLDNIARVTAEVVTQLLGPNSLSLSLKSIVADTVEVRPIQAAATPVLGEGQNMPAIHSLTGQAMLNGRTVYMPDLATQVRQYQDAAQLAEAGQKSLCAVPLRAGDRILGALNVASETLNAYSPDEIAQLEQVAAQVAVTLENYYLAEQTRQALKELDTANRRLVGRAWEQYQATRGTLAGQWRDGSWQRLDGAVASTDRPALRLPLRVRGATIGEFSIAPTAEHDTWPAEDIAFAQSLVDQVGQAIENARLIEETESLARRERTINTINSRVRQAIDFDSILKTAVTELGQTLKAARVMARLNPAPDSDPQADNGHGQGDDHA